MKTAHRAAGCPRQKSCGPFSPLYRALLVLAALGCGSSAVVQQAPAVPPARKEAVGKMMRAVDSAAHSKGQPQAIDLLKQAVAEDPELWEARYDLGVLYARAGQLAPARQELERAHQLAPNAEDVVAALAEVLRRSDELGAAADVLSRFVKSYPAAARARRVLVVVLRESGKFEPALEHARELLKRQPGDPAALAELSLTHLEQGQVEVAELLIEEALKAEPRSAVVERAAGLIALKRGEDAIAFSHFAKASELDPNDTAAGLNTATVLLQAGVYDRAEKHFRAVLAVQPESAEAKLGLAAALRGQGSRKDPGPYREAESVLKELLASTPGDWAAAHNLAVLYSESMDRPDEATAEFSRFLSNAPSEHPARAKAKKWVDEHATASTNQSARK
ncbi:MAG TPA: tetratricopeptide repeat protein [Polyangiaceae bacterium]|nr:tetratricopeptide repeat protein [Polyangiaceae bacterium]